MRKVFFRYFAYALGMAAVIGLIVLLGMQSPATLDFERAIEFTDKGTAELTSVEILQNLLLLGCAGVFFWIAARDRLRRPMAVGIGALMVAFLIRELDLFLDSYLLDNLWQVLAAVVLSFAFAYCSHEKQRFGQGWRRSWPSAGLAMIIAGVILLIPFAQLVGHAGVWEAVMGSGYQRVVKVAAEEFVELGAYAIITLGTIEFLYAWSRLPRTRNIAAAPRKRRK